MAQQKVVDYDLLMQAGYSTVKPVSKEKDTVFSKFLDKGAEYLGFQQAKTAKFIDAMPEINMEKVDPEMYQKTVDFISKQRDIIVDASQIMTWYGKKSEKYKEAILKYNTATQAIVNANVNLGLLLSKRQWLVENDGTYNATTNQNQKINANEIVNGTMFDKMDYMDNGNLKMTIIDPVTSLPTDITIKEYKGPSAQDLSLLQSYRETAAGILSLKNKDMTKDDLKDFNINQGGHLSQFQQHLEGASDEAILDLLAVGSLFGAEADKEGLTLLEMFLTNSKGSLNADHINSYGEDVFSDTDSDIGLGYRVGSDEYKAAVEFIMKGDLDAIPGLKNELRQFINANFQSEFDDYLVVKDPPSSTNNISIYDKATKTAFNTIMGHIYTGQSTGRQVLNVGTVTSPVTGQDVNGYYVYVKANSTEDYSNEISGVSSVTNSTGKGGWFMVYYEGNTGYKAHTTRYQSHEIRNYVMSGQYNNQSYGPEFEKLRSYKKITNE
jgi:hypothetical protein